MLLCVKQIIFLKIFCNFKITNASYETNGTEVIQRLNEPITTQRNKLACEPIEDSDQTAHLNRVIDGCPMGLPNMSTTFLQVEN